MHGELAEDAPVSMTAHRTIMCRVAYLGTCFHGSQRQQNGHTVQQALENALERLLGEPTAIVLAGRTDRGVHALGQWFRFTTERSLPVQRISAALNHFLPPEIRVQEAREVSPSMHPRFSARRREYRYWIQTAAEVNPLIAAFTAHIPQPLDVPAMQAAARTLEGTQDFAAWQSAGSPTKSTVRTIHSIRIRRRREVFGSPLLEIQVIADAFLYQMVRNLVGALLAVGLGRLQPQEVAELTAGRDRTQCPPPAPAQGLCLVKVQYDAPNSPVRSLDRADSSD